MSPYFGVICGHETIQTYMEFLVIILLLVLNGIFAMYEIALVSSSKARLETLVSKGNKSARGGPGHDHNRNRHYLPVTDYR